MQTNIKFLTLVGTLACVSTLIPIAGAQSADTAAASTTSPVAFVYASGTSSIYGFAASASGKLTPVPGSPFSYAGYGKLSVSKHFLFAMASNDHVVSSFSIATNGSIKKVASVDLLKYEPNFSTLCGAPPDMQVDRTGATLYVQQSPDCDYQDHQVYLSVHVSSSGGLEYIGSSGGFLDDFGQGDTISLQMAGTNQYAYDGWCGDDDNNTSTVDIYKRESSGMLQFTSAVNTPPANYGAGGQYCAGQVATDSSNHVAVAYQRLDYEGGDNGPWQGPYFLASYTQQTNGELTTTSTSDNMPEVAVAQGSVVYAMSISPSNKYLAVSGLSGFQIFHFNGGDPITTYSAVHLPNSTIQKFGWDKSNHLYVFDGGSVIVFTVSASSGVTQVGSPYTMSHPNNIIVLDLQ